MKKRFLSCFMALALCLTLLPTAALAEGTEGTAQTPPAVGKAADPANGEAKQENQPAAPKQENQSADQEEQQEDSAVKQDKAVVGVQALIDALPAVDELDGMDDEDAMAVYEAFQTACEAYYETLTEEQQAQLKNTEKLAALSGWFSQPAALADGTEENIYYTYDSVDENGNITQGTASLTGLLLTENDTTLSGKYYIVQGNITISGDLTVDGSKEGGLVLCQDATLTVEGALIHSGGSSFGIYGTSNNGADAGELVINNSLDNGAAIRTGSTSTPQLNIYSGEVTINAEKSGKLVEGVELYSTNKIHAATLDAKKVLPAEWRGVSSIKGTSLVLEYCGHAEDDPEYVDYVEVGETQHRWQCKACGFEGGVEACFTNTTISGITPSDNGTHTWKCICGREKNGNCSYVSLSTPKATPDGKGHTANMCSECGSPEDKAEAHTYDAYGKCTACTFEPLAKDEAGDLYGRTQDHSDVSLDVNDALAEGHTITLWRPDTIASKTIQGIYIDFDAADKSVTLEMNGYTLTNSGNPTLTVENGTLKITGDATINQTGTFHDMAAPAVKVTGGTLIFDGKLNATRASGKPAVLVTGGTLRLKEGDVLNGGVSVDGSTTYANVNALLGANLAFAKAGEISAIVKGDVKSISENVTVVAHTHDFKLGSEGKYTCICGCTCPHNEFENGVCKICGKGCAHTSVDENGVCENCKTQMAAKIEAGGKTTYSTDFEAAMDNAANGTKITLLANAAVGTVGLEGKAVTLDLNGKTVKNSGEGSQPIQIGSSNSPASLIITGSGSFTSWFQTLVVENGTLDLSQWTGDNSYICMVTISGANSRFISPTGTERIRELAFIEGADTASLNGGRYDKIAYERGSGIQLGNLLAEDCAFRQNGTFLEYASRLENGDTVKNVEVVPCPHVDAEGGKCLYCGQTGILARVGDTTYDDVSKAVSAWLANGGTLKLFDDYGEGFDANALDLISAKAKGLAIDLNGHGFYKDCQGDIKLGGGKSLTITDSKEKTGSQGAFGPIIADSGRLTLESGHLQGLRVPSSSSATILLWGGKLTGISCPVPIFNLLPNGYALMDGSGLPVDPTITIDDSKTYTVKDSTNLYIGSQNDGSAAIGSDTIPFALSLKTGDGTIGLMCFEWYIVKENGTTQKLAATTSDVTPGADGVYTCNAANMTVDPNGWTGLEANKTYKVLCVVNGKTSDGTSKWQTPMRGFTLQTLPPSLENAEISFVGGGQKMFWPDPTNHSVGKIEISSVFDAYTVTLNGKKLTEGRDYRVISGNTATGIGTYDLTIEGIAPHYSGTKTAQWTVVPRPLGAFKISPTEKQYDGTVALPDGAFLGNFAPMDPFLPDITLQEGTDYVVTDARVDTPDASKQAKPYRYTVELKNPNYVFANGTKVQTWVYGVDVDMPIEITKADAPAAREGALEVINNHADTYTVDLSALLPKLESPRTYGEIEYSQPTVQLASGYYTDGHAKVENGKLILTIDKNPVTTTGSIGTVTVQVTTTNYKPVTLTVNLRSVNKRKLGMFVSVATDPIVYGMTLGDIKLSAEATVDKQVIPGTIAWEDPLTTVPAAGRATYRWTFTPDDTMHYLTASNTINFLVDKATPTGAPAYTAITTGGKTLADAPLTPNASWPSGTVQWVDKDGKPLPASTQVQANTKYTWSFTPADAANYNGATGSVTLYAVSSGGGGSDRDNSGSTGKTETTTKPDGTTVKTETRADGTKIQTETKKDGSTVKTETKKDGSSVTENKAANGSTGTVKTDKNGQTTAETALSSKAIEDAKKSGEPVKAPVEVEATRNSNTAPTVKIELPRNSGDTKVKIPVSNVKPGTVAVLVHADGTEEIVKNSLPTEDGIQLTVNGGATVKIVDNSKDFIDTRNHWAKDAIDFVSARELVNGMNDSIYAPNNSTTRAQLWTILARQNDADLNGGNTWYEKAQLWSKDKDVSDGANPNGTIDRAQMVTMLWRAAGQPTAGGTANFTDVPADSYYANAVSWAVEGGITTGVGGGRFVPTATCTRAQIAAFLYRYMK